MRVWVKSQLRVEIFEKILKFTYKNLNGKLIFTNFLSHLQDLSKGGLVVVDPGLKWSSRESGGRGACINPCYIYKFCQHTERSTKLRNIIGYFLDEKWLSAIQPSLVYFCGSYLSVKIENVYLLLLKVLHVPST